MMGLDNTIWLAGILTEAVVIGLLFYRRVWRLMPLFCVYCVWDFLSNSGFFISKIYFPSSYNPTSYLVQTAIDSTLMFCVMVELAWSVLRPIRSSLPRFTIALLAGLLLIIGAAIWPFASFPGLSQMPLAERLLVHLQQSVSVLRILFFLVLACGSQVLSIGWRDRELQVATGLGLFSVVSLGATMLEAHPSFVPEYHVLNQFVIASFLCSLLYWAFSFAQKEAERREFTPQMQNLLLAVAGVARANRATLHDASVTDERGRRMR